MITRQAAAAFRSSREPMLGTMIAPAMPRMMTTTRIPTSVTVGRNSLNGCACAARPGQCGRTFLSAVNFGVCIFPLLATVKPRLFNRPPKYPRGCPRGRAGQAPRLNTAACGDLLLLIGLCYLDLNLARFKAIRQAVHLAVERLELIDNLLPLATRIRNLTVSGSYRTRTGPLADQNQRLQHNHRNQQFS